MSACQRRYASSLPSSSAIGCTFIFVCLCAKPESKPHCMDVKSLLLYSACAWKHTHPKTFFYRCLSSPCSSHGCSLLLAHPMGVRRSSPQPSQDFSKTQIQKIQKRKNPKIITNAARTTDPSATKIQKWTTSTYQLPPNIQRRIALLPPPSRSPQFRGTPQA